MPMRGSMLLVSSGTATTSSASASTATPSTVCAPAVAAAIPTIRAVIHDQGITPRALGISMPPGSRVLCDAARATLHTTGRARVNAPGNAPACCGREGGASADSTYAESRNVRNELSARRAREDGQKQANQRQAEAHPHRAALQLADHSEHGQESKDRNDGKPPHASGHREWSGPLGLPPAKQDHREVDGEEHEVDSKVRHRGD